MCGICGIWWRDGAPVDPGLLVRMRDTMVHRGPDGAGCVLLDVAGPAPAVSFRTLDERAHAGGLDPTTHSLGLGHRRLSIIDLATGDQPMSSEDGSLWIVFNGEIYNFRELREELRGCGHRFRTSSDTEVILHAWQEFGEDCPERLNGIFAFALWDARRRELFLARDHFGVKPLYYYQLDGRFAFASELKALLCDRTVPRELDLDALNLCLTFRHTPSPRTLFQAIRKLEPGCLLVVGRDGLRQERFRDDSVIIDRRTAEAEWTERLREAIERAVTRQMVSDVPIALSLSSGVDSTTLLALMSRHSTGAVSAFTVGFGGRENSSEIEPARRNAARFGAEFRSQVITSDDYAEFMQRYIWHLEEPIGNESAAAYHFVAAMAQNNGVKVLLNGQGADEAFAGYKRYVAARYDGWLRLGAVPPFSWLGPSLLRGTALGERYGHYLSTRGATDEAGRFLRFYSIRPPGTVQKLLSPGVRGLVDQELPRRTVAEQLSRAPAGTTLERMTFVDTRTSLPDNLLLCEDKMAMAASVEARVPFLDVELMALAERIPGRLKLRGLCDKYIHRKACRAWVGREVASRPQIGFDNAVDLWLRAQLGEHMRATIAARDSFTQTYLNADYVLQLMQEHTEHRRDHQRLLFLLLSVEHWYHAFMGSEKVE